MGQPVKRLAKTVCFEPKRLEKGKNNQHSTGSATPKPRIDQYLDKPCRVSTDASIEVFPKAVKNEMKRLASFRGKDHYLELRKVGDKWYYYLCWDKAKSTRKPTRLMEFNENKPADLILDSGFLVFPIGKSVVEVVDVGTHKIIYLSPSESPFVSPHRHLVIPAKLYEKYVSAHEPIKVDLEFGIRLLNKGINKRLDYNLERIEEIAGAYVLDGLPLAIFNYSLTWDRRKKAVKVQTASKPKPPKKVTPPPIPGLPLNDEVEKFIKLVVPKDVKGKEVELIFAQDISGSMSPGLSLILETSPQIVQNIERDGAKITRLGRVEFGDSNYIHTTFPLTEMTVRAWRQYLEGLAKIKFYGGREPGGPAIVHALKMLKKKPNTVQMIVAVVDDDTLSDSMTYKTKIADAIAMAKKRNISVVIHKIDPNSAVPYIPIRIEINTLVLKKDVNGIVELIKREPLIDSKSLGAFGLLRLGKDGITALYNLFNKSKDERVRFAAAQALASNGDTKNLIYISKLAWSAKDLTTQRRAIRVLGHLGKKTLGIIIKLALSNKNDKIRLEAARVLVDKKEPIGNSVLRELAKESKDKSARMDAVIALVELDDPLGLETLANLIEKESVQPNETTIKAAIFAANKGKKYGIKLLQRWALKTDKSIKAVRALASLGEKAEPALKRVMRYTQQTETMLETAKALAWQGSTAGFDKLEYFVAKGIRLKWVPDDKWTDTHDRLEHFANKALGVLVDLGERASVQLRNIAQSPKYISKIRLNAAKALPPHERLESYSRFLGNKRFQEYQQEIRSDLDKLFPELVKANEVEKLRNIANGDAPDNFKMLAAWSLAQLNDFTYLKAIANDSSSKDYNNRFHAALALSPKERTEALRQIVDEDKHLWWGQKAEMVLKNIDETTNLRQVAIVSKDKDILELSIKTLISLNDLDALLEIAKLENHHVSLRKKILDIFFEKNLIDKIYDISLNANDERLRYELALKLPKEKKEKSLFKLILETRDQGLADEFYWSAFGREGNVDILNKIAYGAPLENIKLRAAMRLPSSLRHDALRHLAYNSPDHKVALEAANKCSWQNRKSEMGAYERIALATSSARIFDKAIDTIKSLPDDDGDVDVDALYNLVLLKYKSGSTLWKNVISKIRRTYRGNYILSDMYYRTIYTSDDLNEIKNYIHHVIW